MTKTVKLAFAMNLLMGALLVGGAGCDAERGDDAATAGTQPAPTWLSSPRTHTHCGYFVY